jgi:hypothetical protein
MVSGELIRLKSLVDDCTRVARVIQREWARLEPNEQEELVAYIRKVAPRIEDLFPMTAAPTEAKQK